MMKTLKLSVVLSIGLIVSGSVAADTLVLRDGRTVSGKFIGSTSRSAHLRTSSGIERYPLRDVQTIRLEPRSDAGDRAASKRGRAPGPRALIVGQGQSQSIERQHSSN
ncbi:MAG: hypothetical protein ACI9DC_003963 [Gammaproteobacteria bacterium]|jgi:hypothetical protein